MESLPPFFVHASKKRHLLGQAFSESKRRNGKKFLLFMYISIIALDISLLIHFMCINFR